MSMREKQVLFTRKIALLISYAYETGYELTFGDAYRGDRKGHINNSLHYDRLAVDLNLFKDGIWRTETKDHEPLGMFWESLGGNWGGRYGDGNHYSWKYRGRK